jgi:3-phenylpropionate/trans-cinnamate dioxygenase ferredoxin reductase subunit
MNDTSTLAIVGASLAGAKAAEAARTAGFDGRIVLIGDEQTAPYERPALSKELLRGEKPPEAIRVHHESFYAENDIELVNARATAVDVVRSRIHLDIDDAIAFDRAVLATGAAPRRLAIQGSELRGVQYLRTLEDALRLRDAVANASRVVVVGAGWIGSEVAASARQVGVDVVLVARGRVPLQHVLGERIGARFGRLHAEHGVTLRLGTGVRETRGEKSVEQVVLDDGRVEEADLVVIGSGVTPRVELAATAGLDIHNGIVTDQYLETSMPGIYAAGDVANAWHRHYGHHLRVEHWANALNQGIAAGYNAAGQHKVYDRLPYFFSDQYDLGLEYVGHAGPRDELSVRGDLDRPEFIAFWQRDGRVTAAMNVNVWDVVDDLRSIITTGRRIESNRLTDPDVSLADLS